jgi:hypothetical protein
MRVSPSSFLGRMIRVTKPSRRLKLAVREPWIQLFIAAGAYPSVAADSMTASYATSVDLESRATAPQNGVAAAAEGARSRARPAIDEILLPRHEPRAAWSLQDVLNSVRAEGATSNPPECSWSAAEERNLNVAPQRFILATREPELEIDSTKDVVAWGMEFKRFALVWVMDMVTNRYDMYIFSTVAEARRVLSRYGELRVLWATRGSDEQRD